MSSSTILLDACVLINLLASEELTTILSLSNNEFKICTVVKGESFYLRSDKADDQPFTLANFDLLIESGLLTVCDLEDEKEEELYVDYSSQLGSGEAMSIAIAQSRGYFLATDDRKARRIFLEAVMNPAFLLSTADLIREWAEADLIPSAQLKNALLNIQRRANFTPRRIDPNFQWWIDSCL